MTSDDFDAVIIGAGHNGLVCAAYLARAGKRVLVLEEGTTVGGACKTEELFPGCRVSTGALWSGMLRPQIINDLELRAFGYSTIRIDPQVVSLLPDGTRLTFWRNRLRTGAGVLRISPRDTAGLLRLSRMTTKVVRALDEIAWMPSPSRTAVQRRLEKHAGRSAANTVLNCSLTELLSGFIHDERVAGALAAAPTSISNAKASSPATAYHFFYMMLAETHGRKGEWGFSVGGMGGTTEALARSATAAGAMIRVATKVQRVVVEGDKAVGVELGGGSRIRSKVVVSNADPKRTFSELVGPSDLASQYAQGLAKTRNQGMATAIHVLLDGLPSNPTLGMSGSSREPYRGVFVVSPSLAYIDKAFDSTGVDGVSTEPIVTFSFPSVHDSTLTPSGLHLLSAFVQFTPYCSDQEMVARMRETAYERVMRIVSTHFPDIRERVKEFCVLTPRDIETRFGISGGHPEHLDMGLDQLFENRPFPKSGGCHTPLRGLYLCGAGTHPGGTVTGIPGHITSHRIIGEWDSITGLH